MAATTPKHTEGWAAYDASGRISPFIFKRRENGENDVTIKILYCGMCHTDIHYARNEWGITMYPVVPGHEITGLITKVGTNVSGFKIGDRVGVGCLAASCLECDFCKQSEENYCEKVQFTYNGIFWDGSITYGGYSSMLVRRPHPGRPAAGRGGAAALRGGDGVQPNEAPQHAPSGDEAWVVGLGGLGHVAVKFAKAFGLHVTVISTSFRKETRPRAASAPITSSARTLDFVLDTVSAKHSLGPILNLLKVNGTLVLVGAPEAPVDLPSFPLIFGKRVVAGSLIGGMRETQEMLDLCGKHNITCDIELVKTSNINEAMNRLSRNDVRYRFVIDIAGQSKL
ncbi:unnamed protein product [Spirodela intermedia]|uniref:cinnamyl-alcohol dehydrogenase n=1 Tax=Spirodela intermedia TaxID=51605 RepID=A0A7I8IGM1_SPIIN|nr:unnamed protein product [Spirodela intermedia]CAA6656012.1 unnamed protein product [Spirodela intermedia]